MFKYDSRLCWPSAEDLPDSDDIPVDNQLQHLIPGLLEAILAIIWAERTDWFFGVDMGIYYHPEKPAIVPDGFLSLGVERVLDEGLRLSYVLWEEQKVPILALEVVSQQRRGEYTEKKQFYAEMEVLYYAIYNPFRRRKAALEIYRLVSGEYVLQPGNPLWMPEIGLGMGTARGTYQGITREWLYWYNQAGERLLTPEERISQAEQIAQLERQRTDLERQRADLERQRAERLAERLRSLGINPESFD